MKLIRDTWLLFSWIMGQTLRNPIWAMIGLFQPLCYLFLFAPLLQSVTGVPGFPTGGALTVFTPGVLVMMALFGSAFTGFGLVAELRSGFIERLRVTPLNRLALSLGYLLRDCVVLLLQSLLLIDIALPLGVHINPAGLVLTLGLLILLALCLSSCSYALALLLKDENALSSLLNTFSLPLFLLSGITLPLTLAPPILRLLASFNPFAYAVNAARALFIGHLASSEVIQGYLLIGLLALLSILWVTRTMQRASE
ncbi:transport permease protein [Dictyobacter vulcani]|uniref:Transport permease protein n=1 Tax=Dictyobacter vulcani TaxID=2607529 RepID=A0A5J4KVF4_9CHLR|nr:ABC transporter permease [Dictyobacter vulcani]GER90490.1 transport permease protein [Dictyobacter vulcani]